MTLKCEITLRLKFNAVSLEVKKLDPKTLNNQKKVDNWGRGATAYTCIYTRMRKPCEDKCALHVCTCTHRHIHTYTCAYANTHMKIYICIHIHVDTCTYECIYTYTCIIDPFSKLRAATLGPLTRRRSSRFQPRQDKKGCSWQGKGGRGGRGGYIPYTLHTASSSGWGRGGSFGCSQAGLLSLIAPNSPLILPKSP